MKTKNFVAKAQKYQFYKWVEANAAMAAVTSDRRIAEMAQKALGFGITTGNVIGARGVCGIVKQNCTGIPRYDRVAALARILAKLFVKLGEEMPLELAELYSKEKAPEHPNV